MPILNDEDLKDMRNSPSRKCYECGENLFQNYCKQCDEYFDEGHKSNCSRLTDPSFRNNHWNHRTY